MHCHFCDREADVVVEREGLRVGVCDSHFREQFADLADAGWPADALDVDPAE